MLSERAIQLVADAKIAAAIDAGEFDRLSGFGKPLPLDETNYDPHWWIRQKIKLEELNEYPKRNQRGNQK